MHREIRFLYTKNTVKSHTLSASLNQAGDLVFNEGDYYPPLGEDAGREMDEYLTVAATDKERVLPLLLAHLMLSAPDEADEDEALLRALETAAERKLWQSLATIEAWLTTHQLPFTKSRWLSIA